MRLIEVDRLITALSHLNDTEHGNRHYLYGIETAKEIAENLPTVEAIPVEWIKEEISNNKGFYNSSLRRLLDEWAERKEE